jgi:ABC-2 type transport system ATP-binding protein
MHIEDMHARRKLRMLLLRFAGEIPVEFPAELGLCARERKGDTCLLEHRGEIGPLLHWLGSTPIVDVAIGTEDLHSLYDRFHGPDILDDDEENP